MGPVSPQFILFPVKGTAVPWWWWWALTVAVESLLPKTKQHVLTHATVRRLVEMLHPPNVLTIFFSHLWCSSMFKKQKTKKKQSSSVYRELGCINKKKEAVAGYHLQSEEHKQRHIVHASLHPFIQSDGPTVIHIDCPHHVFQHLSNHKMLIIYHAFVVIIPFKPDSLCPYYLTNTTKQIHIR